MGLVIFTSAGVGEIFENDLKKTLPPSKQKFHLTFSSLTRTWAKNSVFEELANLNQKLMAGVKNGSDTCQRALYRYYCSAITVAEIDPVVEITPPLSYFGHF